MANQSASSVSTFLHYNFSQIISYLVLSIHIVMHKTTIDPNKAAIAAKSNQNKLSHTYQWLVAMSRSLPHNWPAYKNHCWDRNRMACNSSL